MKVQPVFVVPMYHGSIPNWDVNKKKILESLPPLEKLGNIYSDYTGDELPSYNELILDIISPVFYDSPFREIHLTDMWCQKAYKDMNHGVHNHGPLGWSSILYVELNSEVHGTTKFLSPFLDPDRGYINQIFAPVKEGDIVVFPSTIAHEMVENKSDEVRTVISFNFKTCLPPSTKHVIMTS